MTVPATDSRAGPFPGTGVIAPLPFDFKVFAQEDVLVTRTDLLGVESTLVIGVDYTVTLNPDQDADPGGVVTPLVAPVTGELTTLTSGLDYEQPIDLVTGGKFRAQTVEDGFDRTTMLIKQLKEQSDRTLHLPISAEADATLPVPEANSLLGWNEDATALQNVDPTTLATIVAFGTGVVDLFSGDSAQTDFVLSANPGALANLHVSIGTADQRPGVDFTWPGGTTLHFITPPPLGTDNILVQYMQALPQGTADLAAAIGMLDDSKIEVSQPFTGAVDRTQHNKNAEFISVTDAGAVGGNGVLDKAGFEAAAAASRSVYVPQTASPFILDSLNVPAGVRFWGPGRIQTSGGTVIELSQVSLEVDDSAPRIMFIESDKQGWEELLDIKACGYNTIMAYLWNGPSLEQVIYNAEAVGLKVLVHSKFVPANIASWATLAADATAFDSRPCVVGYYVFDEPALNAISVANQDIGLNYFRALTAKPLSCSENSVTYSASGSISKNYDQILIDVYYPNASATANDEIAAYVRNLAAFGACSTRAKLIPLLGLFNDTGFTKSKSVTVQLANVLAKFSPDGSFGVFNWNAGTAGTYEGVRNVAEYRAAAKRLAGTVQTIKPWLVEVIPIGTQFTVSNRLANVYFNTTDSATQGLPGGSNLVPWYIQNVGAPTDARRQNFTDNGLMYKGTAARCGFAGMPTGICCGFLRWDNRENGIACTISMGSSDNLGYTTVAAGGAGSQVITNGAVVAFYKQLDSAVAPRMPTLDVTTAGGLAFPYSFLKGYLAFTDVPEVAF